MGLMFRADVIKFRNFNHAALWFSSSFKTNNYQCFMMMSYGKEMINFSD